MASSKNNDFGPVINGIALPEHVTLPPEVVQLLPWMGLAELKVTLAAIAKYMRVGGTEPMTFSEFEQATGLSRQAVSNGVRAAMQRGILARYEVAGYRGHISYVYEIRVQLAQEPVSPTAQTDLVTSQSVPNNNEHAEDSIGLASRPITPEEDLIGLVSRPIKSNHNSGLLISRANESDDDLIGLVNRPIRPVKVKLSSVVDDLTTTTLNLTNLTAENEKIFSDLRRAGVYPRTARRILGRYPPQNIQKYLALYQEMLSHGIAKGPGWLVRAIEQQWDIAPIQAELETQLKQPAVQSLPDAHPGSLPEDVMSDLQALGWASDLDEIERFYQADAERVRRFLELALDSKRNQKSRNPAGLFLSWLRSGQAPPPSKNEPYDASRYFAGSFAEYIER